MAKIPKMTKIVIIYNKHKQNYFKIINNKNILKS